MPKHYLPKNKLTELPKNQRGARDVAPKHDDALTGRVYLAIGRRSGRSLLVDTADRSSEWTWIIDSTHRRSERLRVSVGFPDTASQDRHAHDEQQQGKGNRFLRHGQPFQWLVYFEYMSILS